MSRVRMAKKIGFCFGVKRAIDMAEEALKTKLPVYSLGSIIHNRIVVDELSRKGLEVVDDAGKIRGGAVIISSHGISPKIARRISRQGVRIIDTTCPFVLNAQRIAKFLSGSGYDVIIVGDKSHPEVKALVDFVSGSAAHVVKDRKEAGALKINTNAKVSVVSQTTQSMSNFMDVVNVLLEKKPRELRIYNTICKDAEERQESSRRLAGMVDVMLVVGGKNSANTRRLFDVCKKASGSTHLIERAEELKRSWFEQARTVGLTSGASTPEHVIKKVVRKLKDKRYISKAA